MKIFPRNFFVNYNVYNNGGCIVKIETILFKDIKNILFKFRNLIKFRI